MKQSVNTEWWKDIFDDLYLKTDSRSVCDNALTVNEVDFIETALNINKSASILDLCGGQGRHAIELSRRGFANITVLDYSEYLIRMGKDQAKQEGLNIRFIQGDARSTGLSRERFDAVIVMGGSFGYFAHDEENLRILKEIFRLLRPGGTLLLDLPDKSHVLNTFKPVSVHHTEDAIEVKRSRQLDQDILYCTETITCEKQGCLRENNYCIRLYSPDKISNILRSIGFPDISFQADFMDRKEQGDYGTMTNRMVVKTRKK